MDLSFEQVFAAAEQSAKENAINGLNALLGNAVSSVKAPTASPTPTTAGPGAVYTGPVVDGAGGSGFPSNQIGPDWKAYAVYGLVGIAAIAGLIYISRRG